MDSRVDHRAAAAAWRDTLAALLDTPAFRDAHHHRALLDYLVDAVARPIARPPKEAAIALDVFGRDPARFDPRRDAVVRVHVARLRKRLAAAAEQLPADVRHRIEIPLGTYLPVLSAQGDGVPRTASWRPLLPPHAELQRLGVLPVAGPAPAEAADAVDEALLVALSALPHLRLIATAANRHVEVEGDTLALHARRLGADLLLDAHAAVVDGLFVLRLRLARGSDGLQLVVRELTLRWPDESGWADRIAHRAVDALAPWLAVPIAQRAKAAPEVHAEALHKLQQARLHARQATRDSEAHALALVEQAIRLQPDYAKAHMQLAILHGNAANRDMRHFAQRVWQALGHAEHAVRLDPADVDARALLTWYRYVTTLDAASAQASLHELAEQSPRSRLVVHAWGALCSHTGRTDDAVRCFAMSGELEPMDVNPIYAAAIALLNGYRYDDALRRLDEVLQLEPRHVYARRWRAETLAALERHDEALVALEQVEADGVLAADEAGALRASLAWWRRDSAACAGLLAHDGVRRWLESAVPVVHAAIGGHHDRAAALAADMVAARDPRAIYLFTGRNGHELRADPRIDALARGLGWPARPPLPRRRRAQ